MKSLLFYISRKLNYPFVAPDILQISLTYRCNLRCKMCSIAGLLPEEEELSTGQVFKVIDQAFLYGIKEVLLTGGEPFLRKDIFDICAYIGKKGLRSIITTNGALIDNRMAAAISKSEINHIHFSLDGLDAENDHYRGNGTFKKVVDAINLLNDARKQGRHFSLGMAVTVMNNNVHQLYDIMQLADNLGVDVINFQPLIGDNSNFIQRELPENRVSQENIPVLRAQIDKVLGASWKHISLFEEPYLKLLVKYYEGTLRKRDWVCFGGFKTVFICFSKKEPLVYTCHGICGNLNKVPLKKAWTSADARKLRMHSRDCKNLCIQSCYSRVVSGSLSNALGFKVRKG